MGFFDKNKALIITVLLFSIMLLAMVNIHLSNSNREVASTLIDLANIDIEEPEKTEKEAPEPTQTTPPKTVATHQAFSQNQVESKNFESRLNEIFERNSAESTSSEVENTTTSSGEVNLSKNSRKEQSQESQGDGSSERISTRSGNLKNSSISFSLVGRNAIDIPNPIYTCDTSGKVVINITVNAEGAVTSTAVNKASSSTTNECLTKRALEYSEGAIFTAQPGKTSQIGTITYNFQG